MSSPKSESSWEEQDVIFLEYEIGNENNPTDRIGRQILRLSKDDRYELTWIRRNGTHFAKGSVRKGLTIELVQYLQMSGFPNILSVIPPPGGAIAKYSLILSSRTLRANIYPPKAEETKYFSHIQTILNQLTRELAGERTDPEHSLLVRS